MDARKKRQNSENEISVSQVESRRPADNEMESKCMDRNDQPMGPRLAKVARESAGAQYQRIGAPYY
jgi:hypothetical protein